jgi:hypothetical protein
VGIVAPTIGVKGTQSNGLAQISYPASQLTLFAVPASIWLGAFGLTVLSNEARVGRRSPFLGPAILSSGIVLLLFSAFFFLTTANDEGPRCLNGCAASLLLYYNEVYATCAVCAVLGSISFPYGVLYLRMKSKSKNDLPQTIPPIN